MSHWFHRNPIKATAQVKFELRGIASGADAGRICCSLRDERQKLLTLLRDPGTDVTALRSSFDTYCGLLHGLVSPVDGQTGDSKLRNVITFKWSNSTNQSSVVSQADSIFELGSMMTNVALWYSKHAAKIAAEKQELPTMDEAKEVHKSLRTAGGFFKYVKDQLVGRLVETPERGTDLDPIVLDAYVCQCSAEAQEITLARAVELKHANSLISGLAYETSKMFLESFEAIKVIDDKNFNKWRKYLQMKHTFYTAYAFNYHGLTLLADDKCGEAIKCMQECLKLYERSGLLAKEFASAQGPGQSIRPDRHLFYRKLGPIVQRTVEKCERENSLIYHQKIPPEPPELALKATHGLASPEEFSLPTPSELWTPKSYEQFDLSKSSKKPETSKKDVEDPKEKEIKHSDKDPKTDSGCVIA